MKTQLILLLTLPLLVFGGEKIISVPYSSESPLIDGRITEECWNKTEYQEDFLRPGTHAQPTDPTSVKMLFNESGIYLAFKCHLAKPEVLAEKIRETAPNYIPGNCPRLKGFYGHFRIELFLDVNASGTDMASYQILINSLNQYGGHRGGDWSIFDVPIKTVAGLEGGVWTLEVHLAFENLKLGDVWGFNLCVEQMQPTAAWCNTDGPYFNPRKFGRMIFGDYKDWSRAASAAANVRLKQLEKAKAQFQLYGILLTNALAQHGLVEQIKVADRADFLKFNQAYTVLDNLLKRMEEFEGLDQQ